MDNDRIEVELTAKRQPGALLERLTSIKQQAAALVGAGVPPTVRALLEQACKTSDYSRYALIVRSSDEVGT